MTDGEVGSPVGLERGLQRVLMFLRSPLQSANCDNTVAQARRWKHTARWWRGCFLIKEPLQLVDDGCGLEIVYTPVKLMSCGNAPGLCPGGVPVSFTRITVEMVSFPY